MKDRHSLASQQQVGLRSMAIFRLVSANPNAVKNIRAHVTCARSLSGELSFDTVDGQHPLRASSDRGTPATGTNHPRTGEGFCIACGRPSVLGCCMELTKNIGSSIANNGSY